MNGEESERPAAGVFSPGMSAEAAAKAYNDYVDSLTPREKEAMARYGERAARERAQIEADSREPVDNTAMIKAALKLGMVELEKNFSPWIR